MKYNIDKESKADEGLVVVEFVSDDGVVEEVREYKTVNDMEKLYLDLHKGKIIDISNHYIEDFCSNNMNMYLLKSKLMNLRKVNVVINAISTFFHYTQEEFIYNLFYMNFNHACSFDKSIFNGRVSFNLVAFNEYCSFEDVYFNYPVEFSMIDRATNISFKGAIFNGCVKFNKVNFIGLLNIKNVKFRKPVVFTMCTFNLLFYVSKTIFENFLSISFCNFNSDVKLDQIVVKTTLSAKACKFDGSIIVYNSKLYTVMLVETTIQNNLQLLSDNEVLINQYILIDTIIGGGFICSESLLIIVDKLLAAKNNLSNLQLAKQILLLKNGYKKQSLYEDEDEAYIIHKKYYDRHKYIDLHKDSKLLKKIYNRFLFCFNSFVGGWIGGYGTQPKKVFRTMIMTLVIFTGIYMLPYAKFAGAVNKFGSCFWQQLRLKAYYSLITFLTIGYGEINPYNEFTAFFSGLEGFIGLFLMSYFTVAFARKILR